MSSHTTVQGNPPKKAYQAPTLTVFGPLSKLTQNGTAAVKENNGKTICGPSFEKSGGSSC